eukprot:56269-Heterocapsa_arctica.AAC.1
MPDETWPFAKLSSDVVVIGNIRGCVISPPQVLDFPPKVIDRTSGDASIYRIFIKYFVCFLGNASFNLPEPIDKHLFDNGQLWF